MAEHQEFLQQAIDRNTAISLALPSAGLMRQHRSRLLNISDDGCFILVESIPGQADAIDDVIRMEQPATVAFRVDTQNVEFNARIIERIPGYFLNASTRVEALRLEYPKSVKVVQRRADYRVSITEDSEITFKFWRISEKDDMLKAPASTAMMEIVVRDLSAGGLGGTWKRGKDDPAKLAPQQRLRVEIDCAQCKTVLDARIRFLTPLNDPDLLRVGVQFSLVSSNLQDRQKMAALNKVLGELQRQELRRLKIAR